jgi:hypothetical protein
MTKKRIIKRSTETAARIPMTCAEAFEAGRRAHEAAVAESTGAMSPIPRSRQLRCDSSITKLAPANALRHNRGGLS